MVLPAIGKMDIVDNFALHESHQRILSIFQLIAAKRIAVIVQPLAPAFDATETDFADDAHGAGSEGEKPEQIRQMNPFLKRSKSGPLIGERAEPNGLTVGEDHFETEHHVGDPTVPGHAIADMVLGLEVILANGET